MGSQYVEESRKMQRGAEEQIKRRLTVKFFAARRSPLERYDPLAAPCTGSSPRAAGSRSTKCALVWNVFGKVTPGSAEASGSNLAPG
jgi:hypothetical protein